MSLFQSNLRKQIRNLPKILNFVKKIYYYSELFTSLLRRSWISRRCSWISQRCSWIIAKAQNRNGPTPNGPRPCRRRGKKCKGHTRPSGLVPNCPRLAMWENRSFLLLLLDLVLVLVLLLLPTEKAQEKYKIPIAKGPGEFCPCRRASSVRCAHYECCTPRRRGHRSGMANDIK